MRTKEGTVDDGSFFFFIEVRGGREEVAFKLDGGFVGLFRSVVLDARLCAGVRVGGSAGSVLFADGVVDLGRPCVGGRSSG